MLVALDSFKGTLSSAAAGRAAARGLCLAIPRAQVTVALLADGGEGRKLVSVADARTAMSMFFAVVDEQVFFSMGTFEGDVSVRTLSRQ